MGPKKKAPDPAVLAEEAWKEKQAGWEREKGPLRESLAHFERESKRTERERRTLDGQCERLIEKKEVAAVKDFEDQKRWAQTIQSYHQMQQKDSERNHRQMQLLQITKDEIERKEKEIERARERLAYLRSTKSHAEATVDRKRQLAAVSQLSKVRVESISMDRKLQTDAFQRLMVQSSTSTLYDLTAGDMCLRRTMAIYGPVDDESTGANSISSSEEFVLANVLLQGYLRGAVHSSYCSSELVSLGSRIHQQDIRSTAEVVHQSTHDLHQGSTQRRLLNELHSFRWNSRTPELDPPESKEATTSSSYPLRVIYCKGSISPERTSIWLHQRGTGSDESPQQEAFSLPLTSLCDAASLGHAVLVVEGTATSPTATGTALHLMYIAGKPLLFALATNESGNEEGRNEENNSDDSAYTSLLLLLSHAVLGLDEAEGTHSSFSAAELVDSVSELASKYGFACATVGSVDNNQNQQATVRVPPLFRGLLNIRAFEATSFLRQTKLPAGALSYQHGLGYHGILTPSAAEPSQASKTATGQFVKTLTTTFGLHRGLVEGKEGGGFSFIFADDDASTGEETDEGRTKDTTKRQLLQCSSALVPLVHSLLLRGPAVPLPVEDAGADKEAPTTMAMKLREVPPFPSLAELIDGLRQETATKEDQEHQRTGRSVINLTVVLVEGRSVASPLEQQLYLPLLTPDGRAILASSSSSPISTGGATTGDSSSDNHEQNQNRSFGGLPIRYSYVKVDPSTGVVKSDSLDMAQLASAVQGGTLVIHPEFSSKLSKEGFAYPCVVASVIDVYPSSHRKKKEEVPVPISLRAPRPLQLFHNRQLTEAGLVVFPPQSVEELAQLFYSQSVCALAPAEVLPMEKYPPHITPL